MSALGERLNEIHANLLAGSRTASLELFTLASEPITGHVMRKVTGATEDEAHDCALKAIMGYLEDPDRFDPAKSSLWSYLCMVAAGDGRDAVRKRSNNKRLMKKDGFNIELWGAQTNKPQEDVEKRQDAAKIMRLHGDTIAQNESEKRVLALDVDAGAGRRILRVRSGSPATRTPRLR